MMDPAARLLRLLSLLQSQPQWRGEDLAERLGVTTRTVRRDVSRLRDLGYPVDAAAGIQGGYQLGAGGRLPPLLLDDDEAVAIAVGLRLATASAGVSGIARGGVAALAKLDQVLPVALRERVRALHETTVPLTGGDEPAADAETLVTVATACRRSEAVTFRYRTHDGTESDRRVEPGQIVHTGRRWYLVGFDLDRRDWRTYRIDRIAGPRLTGHRFHHSDPPDAAALVAEATTVSVWRYEARLRLGLSLDEARRRFPQQMAVVEPGTRRDARPRLRVAADDLGSLAWWVAGIDCEFTVESPPELVDALAATTERLTRTVAESRMA